MHFKCLSNIAINGSFYNSSSLQNKIYITDIEKKSIAIEKKSIAIEKQNSITIEKKSIAIEKKFNGD